MPIRIKKDKNADRGNNTPNRPTNNNTGGGGGLIAFAPLLSGLFKKKPKLALIIAGIGALLYFSGALNGFLGIEDMNQNNQDENNPVAVAPEFNNSAFSTGSEYDEEKYVNTEIYASHADNKKNPMPNKMSLLEYAPKRLNQGSQGSCVGCASSYAARATGKQPNLVAMSPSFLYNQIALSGCQGTNSSEAMKSLQGAGDLPFSQFRYNERSCDKKPTNSEKLSAITYKIKGYNRLTYNGDKHRTDVLAIKQNLAQGAPVVIGMMVGGSFMQGREVWKPTRADFNQRSLWFIPNGKCQRCAV